MTKHGDYNSSLFTIPHDVLVPKYMVMQDQTSVEREGKVEEAINQPGKYFYDER